MDPQPAAVWQVLITAQGGTKTAAYTLPTTTRMTEVKQLWIRDSESAPDTLVFLSATGRRIPEQQTLWQLGETFPQSRLVRLEAATAQSIGVQLYEEEAVRRINLFLHERPEELLSSIRDLFAIPADRAFGVRLKRRCLDTHRTLAEQGVTESSVLIVDLAFRVKVTEVWSGGSEEHLIFASEPCKQLLEERATPQRLKWRGREVKVDAAVKQALKIPSAVAVAKLEMELEVVREVTLMTGDRLKRRLVWPSDRVAQIGAGLTHDGVPLSPDCTLADAGVPEMGVLVAEMARVAVVLSSGECHEFQVAGHATVGDVHAAVAVKEGSEHFVLRRGSLLLPDPGVKLADVGTTIDAPLAVDRRKMMVTVEVDGRSVSWSTERRSLRFCDLMSEVTAHAEIEMEDVMEKVLHCAGCSRTVWSGEAEFQEVPVACCRVRSLHLIETKPVCMKDAVLEAKVPEPTADVSCPLYLFFDDEEEENVAISPRLRYPITVGSVRAEVAATLGVEPAYVRMSRWMGTTVTSANCSQVCDAEDKFVDIKNDDVEYGTEEGEIVNDNRMEVMRLINLYFDEEKFPLVPGRRCVINVEKLERPSVTCKFYIWNQKGIHFRIQPLLPQPAKVRDLRRALAYEMKMKPGCINIGQPFIKGPSAKRYVPVCRADGDLAAVTDDNVVFDFGDAEGDIRQENETADSTFFELRNDNEDLLIVPRRTAVIDLHLRHPPAKLRPLYLRKDDGTGVSFTPFLPKLAKVSDVRDAVSALLKVGRSEVQMRQWTGDFKKETCVQVCDEDGDFHDHDSEDSDSDDSDSDDSDSEESEFGNADGDKYRASLMERKRLITLRNEEATVVLAPKRKSVIHVSILNPPAEKRMLYLRGKLMKDVTISAYFSQPIKVGHVREEVAAELGIKLELVKLHRWSGLIDRTECFQVCDEDEEFLPEDPRKIEYSDRDGFIYRKKLLKGVKLRLLDRDDDEFLMIPGKKNVVDIV